MDGGSAVVGAFCRLIREWSPRFIIVELEAFMSHRSPDLFEYDSRLRDRRVNSDQERLSLGQTQISKSSGYLQTIDVDCLPKQRRYSWNRRIEMVLKSRMRVEAGAILVTFEPILDIVLSSFCRQRDLYRP